MTTCTISLAVFTQCTDLRIGATPRFWRWG